MLVINWERFSTEELYEITYTRAFKVETNIQGLSKMMSTHLLTLLSYLNHLPRKLLINWLIKLN